MLTSLSGCFGDEIFLEEDRGIPGGLTLACLRSSEFTSMNLHVLYEEGYQPEAMELLKQRLDEVCDKPGGINIITEKVDFSHGDTWSADDVRTKRWNIGSDAMSSETLTWYFLFPSGMYEDESVLGVAVDASTVAIFLDSIEDAEGFLGRPSSSEIERSVTVHESGHLLGLVNTVYTSDVDHEDPDHPHHSNNEDSVMYWAVETNTIGSFFSNDIPDEFDNDDKMDLEKMADGTYSTTNQVWG
jgi:hypothetical protein